MSGYFWRQVGPNRFEQAMAVRPTRFAGIGYANFGARHWQFVDMESPCASNPCGFSQVGPLYPTKAELLADAPRYCAEYGCAQASR